MHAKHADVTRESTRSEGPTSTPWWAWGCGTELGPGDIANYRRFFVLSIVWGATFVFTIWTLKTWGDALGPVAYALALVPTAAFLAMIWAYVRFLDEADELTRKIHMEAMAAGFGAGLVCMLGYPLLEIAGAPPLDLNDAVLPAVVTYVLAFYFTKWRYR